MAWSNDNMGAVVVSTEDALSAAASTVQAATVICEIQNVDVTGTASGNITVKDAGGSQILLDTMDFGASGLEGIHITYPPPRPRLAGIHVTGTTTTTSVSLAYRIVNKTRTTA